MKRGASMDESLENSGKKVCTREKEPYYLFVNNELLVRVAKEGKEERKEEQEKTDEQPLLDAINKAVEKNPKDYNTYKTKKYIDYEKSSHMLEDIRAGKTESLLELINKHGPNFVLQGSRSTNLFHLCMLGGFIETFRHIRNRKFQESRPHIYLELAAIGGHTKMCELALAAQYGSKLSSIVDALKAAKYFRQYKFQSFVTSLYREEEMKEVAEAKNKSRDRLSTAERFADVYRLPSSEPSIPSLVSICTQVVASEASIDSHTYASRLLSLPSNLFELVCLNIAEDGLTGCETLSQLQRANPDLGKMIPTAAWVNASKSAEDKTRRFTEHSFITDTDFELPLIDVFAEADSFVVAAPDEFEQGVTTILQQPREPGAPSIVNQSQFSSQFKEFTLGIFEDFDFSNMVIIGGSVIGSLLPIPANPTAPEDSDEESDEDSEEEDENEEAKDADKESKEIEAKDEDTEAKEKEAKNKKKEEAERKKEEKAKDEKNDGADPASPAEYYQRISPFKSSDIDICLFGLTEAEFRKKLLAIYNHVVAKTGKEVKIYRSSTNVVMSALFPYRHIQISLVSFRSIWHILTGVDIDCSAFAFDGKTLWASPRARLALNHRWTIVDPDLYKIRGCPNYELRLVKYARRGFSIVDRFIHSYEDLKEEPEVDENDYTVEGLVSNGTPGFGGAALVSAIVKFPKVAKIMRRVAAKGGFPYGPKVNFDTIESYLEDYGDATNTGYGPSDTCPVEVTKDQLEKYTDIIEEISGFVDMIDEWYASLSPIVDKEEEEEGEEEKENKKEVK